jgi:hypothetical protein
MGEEAVYQPLSSCTYNKVGWDLCAGSVREPITALVRDVDAAPAHPRDRNRLQGSIVFRRILTFTIIWGTCFRSNSNSSGANTWSSDTVLTQCSS